MEKFFCSRVQRGATACGEQCDQCKARADGDRGPAGVGGVAPNAARIPSQGAAGNDAQMPAQPAPAEPQGPQLVGELRIQLYDNGQMRLDGPLHDRILFGGLLRMADIIERETWLRKQEQQRRQMEALAKEPFWKRKWRERAERKAKEKATHAEQVASAIANSTIEHNDELSKALAENAKKPN